MIRIQWLKLELLILLVLLPLPIQKDIYVKLVLVLLIGVNIIYMIISTKKSLIIRYERIYLAFIFWLVWTVFVFVYYGKGIERLIQVIAVITIFYVASYGNWTREILIFARNIEIILLLSWSIWFLADGKLVKFSAYYSSSNTLGMLTFTAFLIFLSTPFKYPRVRGIVCIADLVLMFFTSCRSVWVAFIAWAMFYLLIRGRKDNKNYDMSIWFIVVVAFVLSFSVIYPLLESMPIGDILTDLSRRYFNKNFFSGRQRIWSVLLVAMRESPLVGYGLNALPRDFLLTDLSAHNLYLQMAIQGGIINAGLLLLILYEIFAVLKRANGKEGRIIACYILGMLGHETLEVSITQNNWPTGMAMWLILGMGIALSKREKYGE